MRECSQIQTAALTHPGLVRRANEDRYYVKCLDDRSLLVAVADGMGGGPAGGEAADTMREALMRLSTPVRDPGQALVDAVMTASETILESVRDDPQREGMGTTVTATFITNGVAHWVHVGDTRFYVFREGRLIQVTVDQTLVQVLVEEGRITADQARTHPYNHLLDQCVGCPMCTPETGEFPIQNGDLLLHTSDGLHDALSQEQMTAMLSSPDGTLEDKAAMLIQAALDRGGRDNMTVVTAAV